MSERFAAFAFDGRTADAQRVILRLEAGALVVEAEGGEIRLPLAAIRFSEPFAAAPRIVYAGDRTFEIEENECFDRAIEAAGILPSPIVRLQRFAPAVALALGLLVTGLAYGYLHGIPAAASWAAHETPLAVQQRLGDEVLAVLDRVFLEPSTLPEKTRMVISVRFAGAALIAAPEHSVRVEFRRYHGDPSAEQEGDDSERHGMINAFALPGGTIVVLDGLVLAADPDQVFAVLGHELGHVVSEHSMRSFYQSAGVAALAGLAWGDFSSLAASVPAALGLLRYDRALEMEADAFALRFLTLENLRPQVLCDFFAILQTVEGGSGEDEFPEFLSTHPDTDKRIERLCPMH